MDHLNHNFPAKAPKGAGQLVLYLDYDGVLHHEKVLSDRKKGAYLDAPAQYRLFLHAELLLRLLEPFPEVKIVLSTSWVRALGYARAAKRLPKSLQSRVIGATFHSQMVEAEFLGASRGMQVCADVERRQPRDWLALDDDYLDWPTWCLNKLVRTDGHEGIGAPGVAALIAAKLATLGAAQ